MDLTKNITLGVYLPGDTFIHRLDPRTKILAAIICIALLLFLRSYIAFALFALFMTITIIFARIPLAYALCGLKPMLPVLVLMWIFQLFLFKSGNSSIIFEWWILQATTAGLHMGNIISLRVLFLFLITTLLTLTTTMVSLTDGLESLLKPLQSIGIPTQELVMTLVIALRFVLILAEELEKIIKAQMARGVAFDRGNFIQKTKKLFPVFLPLFIGAFKRAEELIVAMEARCYSGGRGRTKMKTLHLSRVDLQAAFIIVFLTAVMLFVIFRVKAVL